MYRDGRLKGEPPGFTDYPRLHTPAHLNADQLWQSIVTKASAPGFYDDWGVMAVERYVGHAVQRIVHRTSYGSRFEPLKPRPMGSYTQGFIPVMEELFEQEPYQDPPLEPGGRCPHPRFLDFEAAYHTNNPVGAGANAPVQPGGGPLWCICTHCSEKNLANVTVMRHRPSGILVVVGGNCANNMLGLATLDQVVKEVLKGWQEPEIVGQILGTT